MPMPNHMERSLMRSRAVLAVLAIAATAAACGTDDSSDGFEPTGPFGRVRFVNAVPDAAVGAVNVTLEGLPFGAGLAAGGATTYQPVYTGPRTLEVRRTADTTVRVLDAAVDVAASAAYTVAAIGRAGAVRSVALVDSIAVTPADSARVRIAHLSPSGGNVDVYLTTTTASIATAAPTIANLAYPAPSRYVVVPNGRLRVRVTPVGSKMVAADDTTNVLALGQIRTVLVLDRTGGGTPPRVVTLTDR